MKRVCFIIKLFSILKVTTPSFGADFLYENFDKGIPDSWTIIDNSHGSCGVWQSNDAGGSKNLTGGSGGFALAESNLEECAETELITPSFEVLLNAQFIQQEVFY